MIQTSESPYVDHKLECYEVCEDLARSTVSKFRNNSISPEAGDIEERLSKYRIGEAAMASTARIQNMRVARVQDGFAVRLDERVAERTARVASVYIIGTLFSDIKLGRMAEPEFTGPYEGMSLKQFQEATAVEYARDIVAAAELGVTPDVVRQLHERSVA